MAPKAAIQARHKLLFAWAPLLLSLTCNLARSNPAASEQVTEMRPARADAALLGQLAGFIDEPVKAWMKNKLADLIGGQQAGKLARQVEFANQTVFSAIQLNERLNQDRMNVSIERQLDRHPEYKLVFASNSTNILIAKKANIYFYWEVSRAQADSLGLNLLSWGQSN